MPGLPLQLVGVPLTGLNTKADPKGAPIGMLSTVENAMATRRTSGGVEYRTRNGFGTLTRNILGGGTLSAGVMGASFGSELVVCDGLVVYSYSTVLQAWVPKGRFQTIAADLFRVSGNESPVSSLAPPGDIEQPCVDIAYQGGYTCHAVSFSGGDTSTARSARVYVRDNATGGIVGSFTIAGEYRLRLCALANAFFVFSWTQTGTKIRCRKIATATPSTISAAADVATDANTGGIFDADVDVTNGQMWVAYQNTTPTLTIKSWTTGNAAGVSSTYAGVNPKYSVGFLRHDYANGKGYVGVGALNGATKEARVIEFLTASGAENANTLLESAGTGTVQIDQITGYRASDGTLNAQWFVNSPNQRWPNSNTRGYSGGTKFMVMSGASPNGRVFKVGTKWYLPVALGIDETSRSLLLELDENTTGANGTISIAGMLQNQDAGGRPSSVSCLPSVASLSSTKVVLALTSTLNRQAQFDTGNTLHYAVLGATLDFTGAGLGRPVEFNGVLHLPGLAHKVYDGKSVVEAGFYADALGVDDSSLTDVDIGGGGGPGPDDWPHLTPLSTYQYCTTVARFDAAGRISRSTPSAIVSIVMGAGGAPAANSVTGQIFPFTFTESDPIYNLDQSVTRLRIELWRTEGDGDIFYLNQVLENDANGGPIAFTDELSDPFLRAGDILYTTNGELDNQKAPAVKVLAVHAGRMFAITGDRSVWHSKLTAPGFALELSDDLRFLLDDEGGAPVALASVDSSLAFFKRNRTYLLSGVGPDDEGNNPFAAPQPLNVDLGAVSAVAVSTPEGAWVRSAKGFALLSRSIDVTVVEGSEAFDALTVTGGTPVDGSPFVAFSTSDQMLVRDWQLGQWYEWTNAGSFLAGVACFRWRNQLCVLGADGTVKVQTAGQFFDGSNTAIDSRVELAWINLNNARVYKVLVRGDVVAACTLSGTFRYDLDDSDNASKSIALTAGSKLPSVFAPNRGDLASLRLLLHWSATVEAMRLTSIDLEVGIRPGAAKHRAGQYAT